MSDQQVLQLNLNSGCPDQVRLALLELAPESVNLIATNPSHARTSTSLDPLGSVDADPDHNLDQLNRGNIEGHRDEHRRTLNGPSALRHITENEEQSYAIAEWLRARDQPWSTESRSADPAIRRFSSYYTLIETLQRLELEEPPLSSLQSSSDNSPWQNKGVLPPALPPSPADDPQRLPRMAPTAYVAALRSKLHDTARDCRRVDRVFLY